MIYVVEIPNQALPRVWSGVDKNDVISKIYEAAVAKNSNDEIYVAATGRDLLEMYGYPTVDVLRADLQSDDIYRTSDRSLLSLVSMIDTFGLDAMLYKRWYDVGYRTEPIDKWETYLDYNSCDLNYQKVYMTDEEARAAVEDDSAWLFLNGTAARKSLRKKVF